MPVDASIALGVKPLQIESPVNQMAKMYEMQNMQQSNQLNQLKMSDLQRAAAKDEDLNALVRGFTPDMTTDDQVNALTRRGHFAEAKSLAEHASKLNLDKRATENAKLDNIIKVHGIFKTNMGDIISNPTLAKARSVVRKTGLLTGIDTADDDAELLTIGENPTAIREWATRHAIEADKLLGKPGQRDIGGSVQDTMVDPITGVATVTGTTAKTATPGEQKPTFNQGAWYYPPTAENPQGAVIGESRADKPKPLTAKQDTDLQHNIGKDRKTALDAIASFGDVKLATQKVREIPTSALENVAGWTGYLPSVSGASQEADTDIANLKGKVTSLGKIAASAGGAIGTMAVQEWTIIRDMIASLDEKKQTPAKFKEQMDLIDAQLAGAETRLRDAYATTHQEDFVRYPNRFELPAAGAGAPPPPAAAAKRNPKDEAAYQAYIKAHPTKAKAK